MGGVYVGNPLRRLYSYEEWQEKIKEKMRKSPIFDETYKIGVITEEMKKEMINTLDEIGFIR